MMGRVDIDEVTLLEEAVNGVGRQGADAEHGLEGVCPRAQMGNGPQVFHACGAWAARGSPAWQGPSTATLLRLDLKGLLGVGRQDELARHDERRADVQLGDGGKIFQRVMIDDLHRCEKRPVREHNKAKGLGRPQIAHPAAKCHRLVRIRSRVLVKLTYCP